MRWRRNRPDPISAEAKQARAKVDQQAEHAKHARAQAEKQLRDVQTLTATLAEIRKRNHFAEAIGIVLGGKP